MKIQALFLSALLLAGFGVRARAADGDLRVSYAGSTVTFTPAEIAALPHQAATAFDAHEKKSHVYSGVPVRDLLARAGAPFGEKLRGRALQLAVISRSRDGYGVVYALAEFDDNFRASPILLVDREDGLPLGPGAGPFRLVAPGDKRPARWPRLVTSLDIVTVGALEARH